MLTLTVYKQALIDRDANLACFIKYKKISSAPLYKPLEPGVSMIIAAPCPEEEVSKHGIIELDVDGGLLR